MGPRLVDLSPGVAAPSGRPAVAARVKDRVGSTCRVDVVAPGSIERSVGKARRIVDQRH